MENIVWSKGSKYFCFLLKSTKLCPKLSQRDETGGGINISFFFRDNLIRRRVPVTLGIRAARQSQFSRFTPRKALSKELPARGRICLNNARVSSNLLFVLLDHYGG